MLVARSSARTFGSCTASRPRAAALRCNVSMKHKDLVAAVTAGALLLAPAPAFASLPEGLRSPQGSNSAAIEAKLDALIEQRTGKSAPLPELNEVTKVETRVEKPTAAVPLVAPMAPAVMDPPPAAVAPTAVAPAAAEPAAAETPKTSPARVTAAPAIQEAVNEAPAPAKKGLQQRNAPTAAAAVASSNTGLLIGGGAAVLGVLAAAALSSNNQSAEQTPAATATSAASPAAPSVDATAAAADSLAAGAASPEGTTTSSAN